jgi:pimeloyl-ACP methyl ester carboxylesterase
MNNQFTVFRTPEGEQQYRTAYDAVLAKWPVPYESIFVQTRYGETHVIASGTKENPPLILLHAAGTTATMWFRNVEGLSKEFRVFAVDGITDGRSRPTASLPTRISCSNWLLDVMDGLHIERCNIAGLSHGGWHATNFTLAHPDRVNHLILLSPAATVAPFRIQFFFRIQKNMSEQSGKALAQLFLAKENELDQSIFELIGMAVKHIKPPKMYFPRQFSGKELRQIASPTLLLIGAQERIYNPQRALSRAKKFIPNLETETIQNGGHVFPIEQPEIVNTKILSFVKVAE